MTAFERTTLPNGLRVLTATMPQAQSVSCFVMLAAGSRYETRESNGIAHFAEHMFFKGTERRPTARDIAGEVDAIGGEFNAFTSKEYTGYYVKCAAEHRDVALDVIVDMLRNSKFDAEEIEREKGVIIEEMNMYFDTPRDFIDGVYEELVYGDHPLGWDIIGRKETVQGATRETFLDYLGQWYKPSRMVVGVGGRTGDGLLERIEELLGDLEDAPTGSPLPAQPLPNGSRVKVHTKAVGPGAHLSSASAVTADRRPGPLRADGALDRARRRDVVAALHRGAGAARARLLRLRDQPLLHGRGLALLAGRRRHRPDRRGVETVAAELKKIAAEAVPADELRKAKNFAKGRFVLQIESPHGLIMFGLRREVLEGKATEPEEVLAGLEAVTAEDVQRVAQELIDGRGAAARGDRAVRGRRAVRKAAHRLRTRASPSCALLTMPGTVNACVRGEIACLLTVPGTVSDECATNRPDRSRTAIRTGTFGFVRSRSAFLAS